MPLASEPPQLSAPPKAFTVAEVVSRIRALIDQQFPSAIWVEGELSNCSYPASGHIYFSLVDEHVTDRFSQRLILPCAFYRNANQSLKFTLTDGLKVLCLGQVTTYESKGQYQLKVLRVEPRGIGALQLAFEQLKKRLHAEGLFEEARKRPIPQLPDRVGVITSPSGSAIHDMVSKLRGHFHVVILPVKVEGDGAAQEIVEALETANRLQLADVLIVGRGGGSIEALWAFNEEPVARAMARSQIPVVSAVGHQDDWTIADYVADWRASTPTDAAKLLVQQQQTFREQCQGLIEELLETMQEALADQRTHLTTLEQQLRLQHPMSLLDRYTEQATSFSHRLIELTRHGLDTDRERVLGLLQQLEALSPLAVLARGYSITFRLPQRDVLTKASMVTPGETIETKLARGSVISTVTEATP